jgi:DNA-binding transcriptional ArsR family regulator
MPQEQSYLSYFTPSQMSAEMLEAILVKRQNLAARLVERTKQSVLTPTKHQTLLLGPRGMGKSYLVALVYHRVKALSELEDKIAIAYFAEEEWSITSLTDLLLVILKSLDREYGGLQTRIDALYRLPIREIEGAASALVREFVGDRTLFLLVENLNEIFRGLGEQGQWAFRSFLSERPFVTILATNPSLFAGVTEHESAFYGFFQNIYLEELSVDEATELLEKVAHRRDDTALVNFLKTPTAKERVQAVHDLAGGHPRIYLFFAHLLTQETLDELVTPFMKLLDELTPYYQSRMQMLSPQQRKVIEFLCSARGAISVKEIAAQNLMTPQTASSQLDKLEEMAYVRKTPAGRESLYELREPLLRMVIEVKRGRGEPVRLIVDFLRRWYNRRERQARLAFVSPKSPLTYTYLTASLDLTSFERALEIEPSKARYWFYCAVAKLAFGNWEGCIENIERGFASLPEKDSDLGTKFFCLLLLRHKDFPEKIKQLTRLYSENDALGLLGQGLAESVPLVLASVVSQSVAEEWQAAWQAVQGIGAELDIPVRMLAATVEWKKTRSVRALLALPIEERRILESLIHDLEASGLPSPIADK